MVEDILKLKDKLLNPKRSDRFDVWMSLDHGWRLFSIVVGNKTAKVKSLYSKEKHTMRINELKQKLNETYWYAARCDASRKAKEEGKNKRKKGWEKNYA